MVRDPTNYLVISEHACMYVEKVKGISRIEAKLIKDWGEIENSVSIPAVKSMRDFFAPKWRRPHGGESTMKLPVRKKMGVYTWCTPWLCLWIKGGFPSFSHPKRSWKCLSIPGCESLTVFVAPFPPQPRKVRWLHYSPSLGTSQTKTRLELLLTHSHHQHPSATQQGVMVRPSGSRTPTGKPRDFVFLWKVTKGYMQQKYCSALLYVLQGPNNFTLMQ